MSIHRTIVTRYDTFLNKWIRGYWQGTRFYILRSDPVPLVKIQSTMEGTACQ